MNKRVTAVWILLITLAAGCALPQRAPQKFTKEFYGLFDTVMIFTAYAESQEQFDEYYQVIYQRLLEMNNRFDIYHANAAGGLGNLKAVNDNAGKSPVRVDQDIIDLLSFSKSAYAQSGGTVNVAMGSVLKIWHDWRQEQPNALPSAESLKKAAEHTDIDQIIIDESAQTVFLADPEMRLDVGAVAKGFAVQAAMDALKEYGGESAMLNAGGNIAAMGIPAEPNRTGWNIGVQNPDVDGGTTELTDTLTISNLSAVTSGYKQRYAELDGRVYGHIIDPETLHPAQSYKSVTVLHPDSAIADMLSTAVYILPFAQGRKLLKEQGGDALWCMLDGSYRATDGYAEYSRDLQGAGQLEAVPAGD